MPPSTRRGGSARGATTDADKHTNAKFVFAELSMIFYVSMPMTGHSDTRVMATGLASRSPSRGLTHPHPRPKSPVSAPHPTLCLARYRRASRVLASRASSAALLSLSHSDFVLSLAPDVSTKATRQVVPMNPVMPAHGTSMPRTGPSMIGSTGHTSARAEKTPLVLP